MKITKLRLRQLIKEEMASLAEIEEEEEEEKEEEEEEEYYGSRTWEQDQEDREKRHDAEEMEARIAASQAGRGLSPDSIDTGRRPEDDINIFLGIAEHLSLMDFDERDDLEKHLDDTIENVDELEVIKDLLDYTIKAMENIKELN